MALPLFSESMTLSGQGCCPSFHHSRTACLKDPIGFRNKSNKIHPSSFYYSRASHASQCVDIKLVLQGLGLGGSDALNNELPQSNVLSSHYSWGFIMLLDKLNNASFSPTLFFPLLFALLFLHKNE